MAALFPRPLPQQRPLSLSPPPPRRRRSTHGSFYGPQLRLETTSDVVAAFRVGASLDSSSKVDRSWAELRAERMSLESTSTVPTSSQGLLSGDGVVGTNAQSSAATNLTPANSGSQDPGSSGRDDAVEQRDSELVDAEVQTEGGYTDTSWDNDQRQRYVQGGDRSLGGGGDVGLGGWNVGAHGPDFSGDISSVRGGGDTPPDSPRQHEGLGTSMTTAQASPAERRPLDESIDELRSSFVASFEVELEDMPTAHIARVAATTNNVALAEACGRVLYDRATWRASEDQGPRIRPCQPHQVRGNERGAERGIANGERKGLESSQRFASTDVYDTRDRYATQNEQVARSRYLLGPVVVDDHAEGDRYVARDRYPGRNGVSEPEAHSTSGLWGDSDWRRDDVRAATDRSSSQETATALVAAYKAQGSSFRELPSAVASLWYSDGY